MFMFDLEVIDFENIKQCENIAKKIKFIYESSLGFYFLDMGHVLRIIF